MTPPDFEAMRDALWHGGFPYVCDDSGFLCAAQCVAHQADGCDECEEKSGLILDEEFAYFDEHVGPLRFLVQMDGAAFEVTAAEFWGENANWPNLEPSENDIRETIDEEGGIKKVAIEWRYLDRLPRISVVSDDYIVTAIGRRFTKA